MIDSLLTSVSDAFIKVLSLLFEYLIKLCYLLLIPIDNFISKYIPGLSYLLNLVSSFFTYISNLIPWVVSYLGLSNEVLTLIVGYYVFIISVSLGIHVVKLAIKWYNALVP